MSVTAAVLLTLAYTDQFAFPLTLDEVVWRLIGSGNNVGFGVSSDHDVEIYRQVRQSLLNLLAVRLVKHERGYWQLVHGEANVQLRLAREELALAKWLELEQFKQLVGWIPWIKAVAVTGSLAMNNLNSGADVDFMVVTAQRRLWLTRLTVVVIAWLMGKRRTWRGDKASSWCFNLWLTTVNVGLEDHQQNLYCAHEVLQAKWIIDKGDGVGLSCQQQFYEKNVWVASLLGNYFKKVFHQALLKSDQLKKNLETDRVARAVFVKFLFARVLDLFELLVFTGQFLYMYPHLSREEVTLSKAFFHPRLTKNIIYQRWLRVLRFNFFKNQPQSRPQSEGRNKTQSKVKNKQIVLVTGVFDVLHQEHINFLKQAKLVGGKLVVGVESDVRVRQLKGEDRPINQQGVRKKQLQALAIADEVFILPTDFSHPAIRLSWLKKFQPAVLAVSSHTPFLKEKRVMMRQVGGVVKVVHQHNPAVSSSGLILSRRLGNKTTL